MEVIRCKKGKKITEQCEQKLHITPYIFHVIDKLNCLFGQDKLPPNTNQPLIAAATSAAKSSLRFSRPSPLI